MYFFLRPLRTALTFFHFNQALLKRTLGFLFIQLFMSKRGEGACVFTLSVCVCVFSEHVTVCVYICTYMSFSVLYLCCQCAAEV